MLRAARHSLRRQLWLLRPSHYEETYQANRGRRRPFSGASNTSSPPPTPSVSQHQLERFMHYALNTRAMPLGTMKDEQWDDAVSAMECWLQLEGQVGGYAIDSGERLLQRLVYEHAVSDPKSRIYIQRTETLHMAQKALLRTWLDVSARNKKSRMALERSEKALTRLLDWRAQGWTSSKEGDEQVFPIQEFLALVHGWLDLKTADGSTHAANLLLASTDEGKHLSMANAASELIPCFQKAVTQCIEIIQDDDAEIETSYDSAIALFDRMDFLSDQAGWENMELPEVARKAILENSIFGDDEGSRQRKESISSFEIEVMQKRIVELVSGEADIQKVDRLIEKLAGAMPTAKLCTALTDYFARIGAVERATQWLQHLDQVTMVNTGKRTELSTERFHRVLNAWSRSDTSRAAWRADELVRRMDDLESTQTAAVVVDAETYEILFSIWLESGDPAAHRKVREGFSRLLRMEKKASAKTFKLALQASSHATMGPKVQAIVDSLLKQWSTFKQEDLSELFETIMESLVEQGAPVSLVQKVLQKAMSDQLSITKSICLHSLQAIKHTSRSPAETMDLLAFLGQNKVNFDLSCYQAAVQSLFKFENKSSNEIKSILSRSFPLVTDTILAQPPEQFGYMLQDILTVFTARKMYGEAEEFLIQAENALLEQSPKDGALSPIPIACYQRMMKRNWYTKKNAPKVMDTFKRLLAFYNTGYTNLRPDREIFTSYIKSAAQIVEGPEEVENILDDMVILFETTGDEECKPDAAIFCTVLTAWKQEAGETDKAGERSMTLLERMLSLGVPPDTFTINLVMHNVIKSCKEDTYTKISDLFERLKSSGLEPDSNSLHYLLDACGSAKEEREAALRTCLETLHLIRKQQNGAESITYGMLTKVLRRLVPQGQQADKIAGAAFIFCCEDGLLDSQLKEHFKTLMSRHAWQQVYTSRLPAEKEEPSEWSRRLVA